MSRAKLVWLRSDLRCDDNAALSAACSDNGAVHAVFIATPGQWRQHGWGERKRSFVLRSVLDLGNELATLNIPLHVLEVDNFAAIPAVLTSLCVTLGIGTVFASREYGVDERGRDDAVVRALQRGAVHWRCFDDTTVVPPGTLHTAKGDPYRVFTPFKRAWLRQVTGAALECLPPPPPRRFMPVCRPATGMQPVPSTLDEAWWPIGERAAAQRLACFVDGALHDYRRQRDLPAVDGTSRLSAYLACGVLSARRCFAAALAANNGEWDSGSADVCSWLNELIWREFYVHVLHAFPRVSRNQPMRADTAAIPWRRDPDDLQRWQQGQTGVPLVDAGMRQLLATGWMHNRLRMVTAMFLSKYLLMDWRLGERWFMAQLVDGDLAANNGGWQWSASTGTDAAPYFRVLSPVRQAERFDPDGDYQRRYVPELRTVSSKALARPGCAELLGAGYPAPMVDLQAARRQCIDTFRGVLGAGHVR